jgi:ankyrin repeat protein
VKKVDQNLIAYCSAMVQGDLDTVRKLLEAHPDFELTGPHANHCTWLHWAAAEGQIRVVEFWLDRGWDVNRNQIGLSQEDGFFTALHAAKDAAMTRYLLSRGALVNACHRLAGTPLHNAIDRAVEPSQKGRRRPPGANTEQIRALLEAGADLTLMNGEEEGFTPLAWAIHLRRTTAEQVLREAGAPEKGHWPFTRRRRRPKTNRLDLRKDFDTIYKHLAKCVRGFDPAGGNVLGEPGPVKIVEVGFEYSQAGWLVVVFDTRSDAEPDGEWTSLIEGNELERPRWLGAGEAIADGPITLVQLDGSESELPSGTELAEILGEMVKAVVLKARADGLFVGLSKAPGCELAVEHFSGYYGWPAYEERGKDNLA